MSAHYKEIIVCRLCGSSGLEPILFVGNQHVVGFVGSETENQFQSPLELVLCDEKQNGCGLLQLRHTFSQPIMYETYWYRSGINKTMTEALADVARTAEAVAALSSGDFVIDIGSNDSTLLRSYQNPSLKTIGFEPAKNLMPYAEPGVTRVINDFFNHNAWQKNFGAEKAKIITAIAMFYDLEEPNKFVADIVNCLHDDGVFIVQQNYLPYMLDRNVIDNVSHEHLEYYSLTTFKRLMDQHNLEIFDVELNNVNGGSMRTYVRHKNKGGKLKIDFGGMRRVSALLDEERSKKLNEKSAYDAFASRVSTLRDKLFNFIKSEVSSGKKIHAYGASTRGNSLLQFCGINNSMIEAAAERNPDKWGKKTVGTMIPIISETEARAKKPDYFLILPWQFLDEFVKREADYLNSGGKFIVPLPEFKIISA